MDRTDHGPAQVQPTPTPLDQRLSTIGAQLTELWESRTQVHLTSFGFLHAEPPAGQHLVVDLRDHFRDPHVRPELREMTGRDGMVVSTVLGTPGIQETLRGIERCVLGFLAGPGHPGAPVRVAFGCAGGRHRSVVAADMTARYLELRGVISEVNHLDIERPVVTR